MLSISHETDRISESVELLMKRRPDADSPQMVDLREEAAVLDGERHRPGEQRFVGKCSIATNADWGQPS
jgi:hypothetical protein